MFNQYCVPREGDIFTEQDLAAVGGRDRRAERACEINPAVPFGFGAVVVVARVAEFAGDPALHRLEVASLPVDVGVAGGFERLDSRKIFVVGRFALFGCVSTG